MGGGAMGRYWSVEECGWVTAGAAADPDLPELVGQEQDEAPPVPDQRQVPAPVGQQQG